MSGRVRAGMGTADRAAAAADGRAGSCPRSELARDRRALAGWLAAGGLSVAGRVESIPCVCSVRRWGIRASTVRSQSEINSTAERNQYYVDYEKSARRVFFSRSAVNNFLYI